MIADVLKLFQLTGGAMLVLVLIQTSVVTALLALIVSGANVYSCKTKIKRLTGRLDNDTQFNHLTSEFDAIT